MSRTRISVVLVLLAGLVASSAAFAKTGDRAQSEIMQAAMKGSVKMVTTIFSVKRPVNTPLLDWAKATTEKAKLQRIHREASRKDVPTMNQDQMEFSRDRD
ncbi:MAG TPA: hypothetical protein VHI13_03510 [Candidatus Kapabacteria bacterium]|nr:hypothetical protein [Candidatus Kapabacteria bacterium]